MSGAASRAMISRYMRGTGQEQMIRRRDASGDEMAALARIVNDPKPDPQEVTDYIRGLLKKQHIPAGEAARFLATVPHDPDALRRWARSMFSFVMHQGIHGHAAFPRELYPSPQQAPASPAAPTDEDAGNNAQPGQPPQGA
jgi:hypothetical protein